MISLAQIGVIAASGIKLTPSQIVTTNYNTISGATTDEGSALLDFTDGLVDDSLYDDFVAIWPLVGDSLNNKRFNLMNPQDETGAFRLTYTGTPLSTSKGVQWQSNQGGATSVDISLLSGVPTVGGGGYMQDTNHQYLYLQNPTTFNIGFGDGGKIYIGIWAGSSGVVHAAVKGLIYGLRPDTSNVKSYKDDVQQTTESLAINSTASTNIAIYGGGNYEASMYFIGNIGLWDATKRTAFSNRVATLMAALGRTVA